MTLALQSTSEVFKFMRPTQPHSHTRCWRLFAVGVAGLLRTDVRRQLTNSSHRHGPAGMVATCDATRLNMKQRPGACDAIYHTVRFVG
jgi:hypothetical protein